MSKSAKNPAAVALGRLGGKRKVRKGFATLSKQQRAEIARKGVEARQKKREKQEGDTP